MTGALALAAVLAAVRPEPPDAGPTIVSSGHGIRLTDTLLPIAGRINRYDPAGNFLGASPAWDNKGISGTLAYFYETTFSNDVLVDLNVGLSNVIMENTRSRLFEVGMRTGYANGFFVGATAYGGGLDKDALDAGGAPTTVTDRLAAGWLTVGLQGRWWGLGGFVEVGPVVMGMFPAAVSGPNAPGPSVVVAPLWRFGTQYRF